jgi:hypothetical protein
MLPSGYVKIAIENGTFIVDFPIKIVIFHGYVSLPENKSITKSKYWLVIFPSDPLQSP